MWRMPLLEDLREQIKSEVADVKQTGDRYGGSITAALFLNRFVEKAHAWVHLDVPAWIDRPRPGRPIGGEANAAFAGSPFAE